MRGANAGLCRLLIGDFARGWQEHEWRWKTAQMKADEPDFPQPLWLGVDDIAGKTILLHAEQGLGDTLQFCRYVPRVVARGARVILWVPNTLRELMCTLPCVVQIVSTRRSVARVRSALPIAQPAAGVWHAA